MHARDQRILSKRSGKQAMQLVLRGAAAAPAGHIHDDQPADMAQAQLAGEFGSRFGNGLCQRARARIDIDGEECPRRLQRQASARW